MNMNLGYTQLIIKECKQYGCLRNQVAYILATAYWETARTMKPVVEAYWLSETWRKNNLRYYPWHGRGFVQLTWEANYKKASRELGIDFIADPDKLLEPENSAKILVKGSMEGWFTGKGIPNYITLSKSDFVGARRVINGVDKKHEIAGIARQYDVELKKMGYGEEAIIPEPVPVPKVPEGLDKDLVKSKTNWSTILQVILGSGVTALADLNPYVQALIVLAIVGFGAKIMYERKKYRDEARSIKAVNDVS